ncbi:MAG: VOC family protein [Actinomycetota bacterium]
MTPRFDAIGITVSDMSRSVAFYRLLGLEFPDGGEAEGHVEALMPGGTRLMLDTEAVIASFDPSYEPPSGGGRIGLAFLCDGAAQVDETYAAMIDAGHRAKMEPFDAFWGQRYATVFDPDGNLIDLFAPLG